MLGLSLSLVEWLAVVALVIGVTGLLFSPYRRWLGFMLAGMLYFTLLDGMRSLSQQWWSVSSIEGYLIGVVCSLALMATWLAFTEERRSSSRQAAKIASQIEHRPIECHEVNSDCELSMRIVYCANRPIRLADDKLGGGCYIPSLN